MLTHFDREKIIYDSDLPTNEKFLLVTLNTFVDGEGKCWPGKERLGQMTGMSKRTVDACCDRLEGKGILVIQKRRSATRQTTNLYQIDFSKVAECKSCTLGEELGANPAKAGCKSSNPRVQILQELGASAAPDLSSDLSKEIYPVELTTKERVCASKLAETAIEPAGQNTPVEVVSFGQELPLGQNSLKLARGSAGCDALDAPRDVFAERIAARKVARLGDFDEALAEYRRMCGILGASAGRDDAARVVWAERFPSGFATPEFWTGLRAFVLVKTADEKAKRRPTCPPSFANFLQSPSYAETGIERLENLKRNPESLVGERGGPSMSEIYLAKLKRKEQEEVA